jgi:hypothetical protein
MRRRGLLVCTVVVVAAHAALLETMAGHGLQPTSRLTTEAGQRAAARLVLLDRDRVASLSAPRLEVAVEPAQVEQPPLAASAAERVAEQAASAANPAEGLRALRPTTTIYRTPAQLDVPPRPRSAPDVSVLNGLTWSGTPIRLRVFIDSQGNVVDTQVLQSGEAADVIALVRQVFLATGFTPGIEHGQPVPSYKDIEITVGTPH